MRRIKKANDEPWHNPDISQDGAVGANKAGVALAFVSWTKEWEWVLDADKHEMA